MEFTSRSGQQPAATAPAAPRSTGGKRGRGKGLRIISVLLLLAIAVLIASLTLFIATSKGSSEGEFLDKNKYQAVFLNGGQVYFGKVKELNNKFLTVDSVYYLRVNEQVQPEAEEQAQQDISLAKLGCELHGPQDLMVINRDQITFWENLKDDGQVAKAIAEFVKQNPDGQKCTEPAAS